ncbi:MAG: starch-binding protein [Paludibacteraceae bacterium]|nr:starch-binding protein [Paludibacteraceae bacterium]
MKKFFLLMTAMILAVGAFAAERVIYCKVAQSWWKADGAAVAAYAWSGEGDETVTNAKWPGLRMNPVEGQTDVWSTNFDLGSYEKIIFVRVNGEGDIQDWGAKTADLTFPADGSDLYTVTSEEAVWGDPGVTGEWSKFVPVEPDPDPAKFYITGDSALVVDAGLDVSKKWQADAIKSTEDSYTLKLKADQDYLLKITENGDWKSAKGFSDLTRKPEGVSGDNDGNICFKLTEAADVKVTYIQGEGAAFLIECEKFYVKPVDPDPEPEALYYIAGTMTDWATNKIAATSVRTTLELKAGDHKLKVITLEDEWKGYKDLTSKPEGVTTDDDGNICFTLAEDGNVIISYSKDAFVIDGHFYVKPVDPEAPKFYITGDSALVVDAGLDKEKAWKADAIKSTEDSYELSLKGDQDYQLKIVVGENWLGYDALTQKAEGLIDGENHNIGFKLKEDGKVKVTYALGGGGEVVFKLEGDFFVKTDPEPEVLYYIAGTMTDWETNMIPATSIRTTLELKAGDHKLKVVTLDKQWIGYDGLSSVPEGVTKDKDGNICFTLAEDGNIIISFSESAFVIDGHFYVKPVDPDAPKFYITGNAALVGEELEWNPAAIKVMEETYTFPKVKAGDYKLKITLDGTWDTALGFDDLTSVTDGLSKDNDGNICFTMAEDDYRVVVNYDGKDFTVLGNFYVEPEPELEDGYYLIGSATEWKLENLTADLKFAANADQEGEFVLNTSLEVDQTIKVVKVEKDQIVTWYPEGEGNEYKVDVEHSGKKAIYFRPEGNDEWSAFGGFIWIDKNEAPEENIVIYVVNKPRWEKVLAYIWRMEGENPIPYRAWPGIEMSVPKQAPALAGIVAEDDQVLSIEFPKEFDHIIFNNGEEGEALQQTEDLEWVEEKPYFVISSEKGEGDKYSGEWKTESAATSIGNTPDGVKAVKVLRNGQVLIIKGAKTYTILGVQVR